MHTPPARFDALGDGSHHARAAAADDDGAALGEELAELLAQRGQLRPAAAGADDAHVARALGDHHGASGVGPGDGAEVAASGPGGA